MMYLYIKLYHNISPDNLEDKKRTLLIYDIAEFEMFSEP